MPKARGLEAQRLPTAVPLLIAFGQCRSCGQGRSSGRLPAMSEFGLFRILNDLYGLIGITTPALALAVPKAYPHACGEAQMIITT